MSTVTDLLICTGCGSSDSEAIKKIHAWMAENKWPAFKEISDHSGGNKMLQRDLWACAVNYFDTEKFLQFFDSIPIEDWGYRASGTQLLIKEEVDDGFSLAAGRMPVRSHREPHAS